MQHYPASPREMVATMWRNRRLLRALIQREVLGRYRGSFAGIVWSFFNPAIMLIVYTFVFGVVFKAHWGSGTESRSEFALVLFAGLMVFNLFAECVNRAPASILANVGYVKRVVFPLEILPGVALGSALFHATISLIVWLAAYFVMFRQVHVTVMLLPLVLLPLIMLILGLTWALASLGVYLRDMSQIVGMAVTALMFLSPIFYPANALPHAYQYVLYLNPLTPIIEQVRDVLFWGRAPETSVLLLNLLGTTLAAWLGFAWFQKTRRGFADVV